MPLTKCERCGALFNLVKTPICPDCIPEEDDDRDKVRDLLETEPHLNAERLAEEAEVDVKVVLRMVREGLITDVNPGNAVSCGRCGAPAISMSKKLCQSCLEKLDAQVASAAAKIRDSSGSGNPTDRLMGVRQTFDQKRR